MFVECLFVSEHIVMRNAYIILVEKPEGKTLGRPRRRWEDNVKMNFRGTRWKGLDWFHLAQDRGQWVIPVNTVKKLRVP
jgi:hypothetical protein